MHRQDHIMDSCSRPRISPCAYEFLTKRSRIAHHLIRRRRSPSCFHPCIPRIRTRHQVPHRIREDPTSNKGKHVMKTYRQIVSSWAVAGAFTTLLIASGGSAQAAQEEVRVKTQRPADASAPAVAGRGAETRSVTVAFGDLDMRRAAGANTLYSRLRAAARTVCSPMASRDLMERRDWSHCYSEALDHAVSATGSDELSTLHLTRTGRNVAADVALRD